MDLIEIFKVGTHTDSSGKVREWTEQDLEEIASLYNPTVHEAPIVIGHPEMDSPAYGWVESLKAEGGKLLAKLKDLAPEFVDWVKRGLYKKVSIALYPDLGLRHVGFLGATPPAIKGLKQTAFGDKKAAWIIEEEIEMKFAKNCSHMNEDGTFTGGFDGCVEHMMSCEGHDEDSARKICAYIGRKAGKIHSDPPAEGSAKAGPKGGNTMHEWLTKMKEAIGMAEKQLTPDPGAKFTEADIQAKVQEAKDQTFAEAQKKVDVEKKEKEEAQKLLKEIQDWGRKNDIISFCDALCKEGKLTPALRKIIEPTMIAISNPPLQGEGKGGDGLIEFSDGTKKNALDGIKDFLNELPKVVTFKEVTPKDGPASGGSAAEKLSALTKTKMEAKKDLSYSAAFAEVQRENIELAKELLEEIRPKK
jgi:hypothetical protein